MTPSQLSQRLTCSVPEAGVALGIGRDAAYAAAARGDIPTLRLGRSLRVPVPKLLELLGATPDMSEAGVPTPANATTVEAVKEPRHDQCDTSHLRSA